MALPTIKISGITSVGGTGSPFQNASAATPNAFGASVGAAMQGVGQQISKAGDVANKIALNIQIEDNEAEAKKLDTEAARRVRVESYGGELKEGDTSPQSVRKGYFNLKNEEAIGETDKYQTAVKKHYDDVYKSASNDAVKRMLRAQFDKSFGADFEASSKYHVTQRDNFRKIQSAARLREHSQLGVLGNVDQYEAAKAIITSEVVASAKLNGINDPALIASSIQDQLSTMAIGRVERLMGEGDFEGAEEFAKRMIKRGDLDELKAGKTLSSMRTQVKLKKATSAADSILKNPNGSLKIVVDGFLDPAAVSAAYAAASGLPADIRQEVQKQIKTAITFQKSVEVLQTGDSMQKAIEAISKGQPLTEFLLANSGHAKVLNQNPRALSTLQGFEKKRQLGTLYGNVNSKAVNDAFAIPNDDQAWATATQNANSLTIDGKVIPSTDFTQTQWNKVASRIATAKLKTQKEGERDGAYKDALSLFKQIAPKNLRDALKVGTNDLKRNKSLEALYEIDAWVTDYYNTNNKTWPTFDQIKKHIRNQYIYAFVDDGLFPNSATNIDPTPGLLKRYPTLEEDQKDAIEVDFETFAAVNTKLSQAIEALVMDPSKYTQSATDYVDAYGVDRFKGHIAALRLVKDEDRINRYFQ